MLDSLYNLFLGCHHRRTSFPLSPSAKPGAAHEDMYVVCLDCGKRFHYQWDQMRIGEPMEMETPSNGPEPNATIVARKKSKLRYAAIASTLPILWFVGKAAFGRKRAKSKEEQDSEPQP
jgi:hypothetical protein